MSDEVLSLEEVERILSGMGSATTALPEKSTSCKIQVSPDDKGIMEALQIAHDKVANVFAESMRKMLGTQVEAKVESIECMSYIDITSELNKPAYFNVLTADVPAFLNINLVLLSAMLEYMLGGGIEPIVKPRRSLTSIDLKLAARIRDAFLAKITEIYDTKFTAIRTESNPRVPTIVTDSEVILVIDTEVWLPSTKGCITLGIPMLPLIKLRSNKGENHHA